ncbi:MAG: hypothetical protein AAGE52_29060 [Myxococcota bacterium]
MKRITLLLGLVGCFQSHRVEPVEERTQELVALVHDTDRLEVFLLDEGAASLVAELPRRDGLRYDLSVAPQGSHAIVNAWRERALAFPVDATLIDLRSGTTRRLNVADRLGVAEDEVLTFPWRWRRDRLGLIVAFGDAIAPRIAALDLPRGDAERLPEGCSVAHQRAGRSLLVCGESDGRIRSVRLRDLRSGDEVRIEPWNPLHFPQRILDDEGTLLVHDLDDYFVRAPDGSVRARRQIGRTSRVSPSGTYVMIYDEEGLSQWSPDAETRVAECGSLIPGFFVWSPDETRYSYFDCSQDLRVANSSIVVERPPPVTFFGFRSDGERFLAEVLVEGTLDRFELSEDAVIEHEVYDRDGSRLDPWPDAPNETVLMRWRFGTSSS